MQRLFCIFMSPKEASVGKAFKIAVFCMFLILLVIVLLSPLVHAEKSGDSACLVQGNFINGRYKIHL